MVTGLKVLLAIALIIFIFYLVLNMLGLRINSFWFYWVVGNCPSEIKDFGGDACDRWKTPLFEHKTR